METLLMEEQHGLHKGTDCVLISRQAVHTIQRTHILFPDYIQAFTGCSEVNYGTLWKLEDILYIYHKRFRFSHRPGYWN
jgi:hypothetical protein